MNTQDWIKRRAEQSLDELVRSLPLLRDSKEPDNKEHQCFVLSVRNLDGILHVQYVHNGLYEEKPVGFSYMIGESEHKFSLSENYQRLPLKEGSIIIPLTAHEQGLPIRVDPHGNPIEGRDLHALGIKVDDRHVLPLFIYDKDNSEPVIVLCAEPEYGYLKFMGDDIRREVKDAAEPIQIARRQHRRRELRQGINEFARVYAAPVALLGVVLPLLGFIVSQGIRINYTEQPEPSRIRGRITPVSEASMNQYLKSLEPYSCRPVQPTLSGKDKYWLKGDFQEKSLDFYRELSARGYLPAPFDMRALRARNAGRSYRLDIVDGQNTNNLVYTAGDLATAFQSGFFLIGRGIGEANPSKSGQVNSFTMDEDGVIDLFITLKPGDYNSCIAARPHQFIYDAWLKGDYQWQDLPFAQLQKRVARELEKIARNPKSGLLLPAN